MVFSSSPDFSGLLRKITSKTVSRVFPKSKCDVYSYKLFTGKKKVGLTCFVHDKFQLAITPSYFLGTQKELIRFCRSFSVHKSQSQTIAQNFIYSLSKAMLSFLKRQFSKIYLKIVLQ